MLPALDPPHRPPGIQRLWSWSLTRMAAPWSRKRGTMPRSRHWSALRRLCRIEASLSIPCFASPCVGVADREGRCEHCRRVRRRCFGRLASSRAWCHGQHQSRGSLFIQRVASGIASRIQCLDDGFLELCRFILVYLMPGMIKEKQSLLWRLQGLEIRLRDPGRGLDIIFADEEIHGAINALQGLWQINVHDLVPDWRPGF